MRQQLVNAEKAATEAKQNADELQQLRVPRNLSDTQKARLFSFLSDKPKGQLTIKAKDSVDDARAYGDIIAAFLRDQLGWAVRVDDAIITGPNTSGIWITIRDANSIPPAAPIIHAAFEYAQIPIRATSDLDPSGPRQNEVWLSIGSKK